MADKKKQLVLVVEGTAAMGRYWRTIVSDYLLKLIRLFCGYEATTEAANPNVELALVVFHARGSYSPCLIRRSKWIRDMYLFLEWLSALHFTGGDFCDAAIAEGLAEVPPLFPSPNEIQNGHCILVAASNPYPLSTPVYRPPDNSEGDSESRLADAETVAKSFPECSISLSVICPRKLPKLKAIYNAGKRNPSAADHTIDIVKNPHYLVLISQDFMEACADLSQSEITIFPLNPSPIKMEVASVSPVSVSATTPTSVSPVNESPETVEVDPITVSSPVSTLTFEKILPVFCAISQEVSSLQTSAPSTSQEIISSNDDLQDLKPAVHVPTNALILNKLTQARLTNSTGISSISGNPMAMHMSNVISGGITLSVPEAQTETPTGKLSVSSMSESAPLAGTAQKAQQLVQNGTSMNQNMMKRIPATGTMMPPPPRMSHEQVQSQSSHSTYVKVWEGDLSGLRGDQHIFISRLEGYQSSTSSELLAEDWPPTMLIDRLIPKDCMTNNQHVDKADLLVFRSMDQHGLLRYFEENKLCIVIRLPSQTLLVAVSDKRCRLIGILFPKDMVVFEPQMSELKQPASQQQQQQQQGQVSLSRPKA